MKQYKKLAAVMFSTGLLSCLLFSGTAPAETRTKITSVKLEVTSTIQAGSDGTVEVTANSDTCYVSDVTVLNDEGDWSGSDRPRVSVYLEANEDYYFSTSTGKSMFSFSGEDCTYVSSKRRDTGAGLDLVFKLDKIGNGDLTVSGLDWDSSSGIASWDEVAGAKSYQVILYRNNKAFSSTKSTTNHRYNFSSVIDQQGTYFFRVRAVGSGSEKGDWTESDSGYISSSQAEDFYYQDRKNSNSTGSSSSGPGVSSSSPGSSSGPGNSNSGPGYGNSGSWVQDNVGWWFRFSDGNYPVNSWQYINGYWYHFNQYGYMSVGWIHWNSKWYYCGSNGAMYVNGRTPDGYYVGGDGAWIP